MVAPGLRKSNVIVSVIRKKSMHSLQSMNTRVTQQPDSFKGQLSSTLISDVVAQDREVCFISTWATLHVDS
jgi:hypothetical protein